jgi:hypothetical protein
MAELEPSDALVAAVLRRAVGDTPHDINAVFARGAQARKARSRRARILAGVAGLGVVIALLSFVALRSQPKALLPAHVPGHSTHVPSHSRSGIWSGTYSTDPLSAATLIRHGMKPSEIEGRKTVLTLKFAPLIAGKMQGRQNGTYTQFNAVDGGPLQKGDTGAYAVRGHTITFVSSYQLERTTYLVRRTADGFRLQVRHFYFRDPKDRRIARVIWTSAAFHRS